MFGELVLSRRLDTSTSMDNDIMYSGAQNVGKVKNPSGITLYNIVRVFNSFNGVSAFSVSKTNDDPMDPRMLRMTVRRPFLYMLVFML